MQTEFYHQQILTEPLNDRKSFKSTSSEKGGCRATRFMKRFRALLLDSMNSRSAAGRSTKFQLTEYKITVAQKEKNKNKTFCPVISSVIFQGNNLAKALEENQRMVQLFPQVMLHTLPKYPAYIFTCLFPQDRSSKQVKHLSLRPETSTYNGKVGFIQLLCQYLHLSFSHSNESALKIYISTCSTSTQRPSLSNWKEFSSSSFPKQEGFQSGGNAVRLHIRDPSTFAGKVKKIN